MNDTNKTCQTMRHEVIMFVLFKVNLPLMLNASSFFFFFSQTSAEKYVILFSNEYQLTKENNWTIMRAIWKFRNVPSAYVANENACFNETFKSYAAHRIHYERKLEHLLRLMYVGTGSWGSSPVL